MNENNDLILKTEEIAKTFNDYFGAIVDNLDFYYWQDKTSSASKKSDKINGIIKNYEKHPSTCNIRNSNFSFWSVSVEEVKKIIQDLKTNKAVGGEISTKILKECEFTFNVLINWMNKSIEIGYFPDSLKLAIDDAIFKNEDLLAKF